MLQYAELGGIVKLHDLVQHCIGDSLTASSYVVLAQVYCALNGFVLVNRSLQGTEAIANGWSAKCEKSPKQYSGIAHYDDMVHSRV